MAARGRALKGLGKLEQSVSESTERTEAMQDAHIIYAKSWSSTQAYGDKLGDLALRNELEHWCVDEPWFDNAREDCRFMHCLPVRRGVIVDDEVLDGPRNAAYDEAENRLHVQKALMLQLLQRG